jgi:hypothetical protein
MRVFVCSLYRICEIDLDRTTSFSTTSLCLFSENTAVESVRFVLLKTTSTHETFASSSPFVVPAGDYSLSGCLKTPFPFEPSFPDIILRVRIPESGEHFIGWAGEAVVIQPTHKALFYLTDSIQISLICNKYGSEPVRSFPNRGTAFWSSSGDFRWPYGSDFSAVSVGSYRVCWSALQNSEYIYNYEIGRLSVLGPSPHQLLICFDRVSCTIDRYEGIGIQQKDRLFITEMSSSCSLFIDGNTIDVFPNQGISFPSKNGHEYSFGPSAVNVTQTPVVFRVCWCSGSHRKFIQGGILRIDSYETFYRQQMNKDPSWTPYEQSWKLWLLALLLPVLLVVKLFLELVLDLVPAMLSNRMNFQEQESLLGKIYARAGSQPLSPFVEVHLRTFEVGNSQLMFSKLSDLRRHRMIYHHLLVFLIPVF